ncbi:DUF6378 domain-containing protein [Mycobacteroides abscessus]|uniref:DUF6378 domain-containing protein n=1 Tax=Mycobacteroides abscessus TaxID=36809 RepID=UPI00232FCB7C|nr:DUF6378 domain-containing protein [Mycobacteroides abscessus]MDB2215362.1 DUF6378 domain-containing protein [Mycobacteroides abscessus subsp. massiliense]WJJ56481.1 hypothetical protein PROPHIT493_23 [Mycobacterium phage prophiT49-3]
MTESILQEAERIINGDRAEQYGDAAESFADIAKRWTIELDDRLSAPVTALDVARMMTQLKMSRSRRSYHRDSYVDGAGYLGLTEKLVTKPTVQLTESEWNHVRVMTGHPRQWQSLTDVPEGVEVNDRDGEWRWARDETTDYDHFGPFTEVIGG